MTNSDEVQELRAELKRAQDDVLTAKVVIKTQAKVLESECRRREELRQMLAIALLYVPTKKDVKEDQLKVYEFVSDSILKLWADAERHNIIPLA